MFECSFFAWCFFKSKTGIEMNVVLIYRKGIKFKCQSSRTSRKRLSGGDKRERLIRKGWNHIATVEPAIAIENYLNNSDSGREETLECLEGSIFD